MPGESRLMVLRLEGLLQSWGEHAKWSGYLDTSSIPSKSGVIGMLACAMGIERDSPQIAQLSENTRLAVRADRQGIYMKDYHTVQAAEGKHILNTKGQPRVSGDTVITSRVYLQDACFTVALETDAAWHERILEGLRNPKWCMYLGRKSCVPSRPVLEDAEPEYHDLMDIVLHYPVCDRPQYPMSYECEIPSEALASYERTDERLHGYRRFAIRRVWRGSIEEVRHVSD